MFVLTLVAAVAVTSIANTSKVDAYYDGGQIDYMQEGRVRHAYQPQTVFSGNQAGWMQARVNNVSAPARNLICVEAFRGNRKYHLGCLAVDWSAIQSGSVEFNAPTHWLPAGNYRVVYTYPGMDGRWHRIKSMSMQIMDGAYNSWGYNAW